MNDLLAMAYPKYYIQVSGIEDSIFPLAGAEYAFNKGKKIYESNNLAGRCTLIKGNGGHRFYADDSWPVVHEYLGR